MATTTHKGYRITATYTGSKPARWDGTRENWNHHAVTVTNTATQKRTTFDFWASLASPEVRSRSDLLGAFRCFLGDAISGMQSFDDFCSEFGYDTDSRKAEKTWRACVASAKKAERLLDSEDIYELINSLPD